MSKITRITLQKPGMVMIWRGPRITNTFRSECLTDASRLRLNDVLAGWIKEGRIESRPYVGPGWHTTDLYVVKTKKGVNAGKITEEIDRTPGPHAQLMWRIQNKLYVAFGRTEDELLRLRQDDKRLKNGRVSHILQMYPSRIQYGTVYNRDGSVNRAPEIP